MAVEISLAQFNRIASAHNGMHHGAEFGKIYVAMTSTMQIETKLEGEKLTLKVIGRLDTNTTPDLDAALKLDGVKEVAFDFSELQYISSAGLRVLMRAHKAMTAVGGTVKVLHPNAMVRGVFEITGLNAVFVVEP